MKEIKRDLYLHKLIERKENGSIKVITGTRRSGKSYLLFTLYYDYLLSLGICKDHIVCIPLDDDDFELQREKKELSKYIKEHVLDDGTYYIFLDEIQFCDGFEGVLNGLTRKNNLDIYVTGSNSKSLSTDILTEFRGRGDEVRVYPLNFAEYLQGYDGSKEDAWRDFCAFGGLPLILTRQSRESKMQYLNDLFKHIYIKDIVERNNVQNEDALAKLTDVLASCIGAPTNPTKIANTFASNAQKISPATVNTYLKYLENSFLIEPSDRYDVKGKKYIYTTKKYYFVDSGLRNARLNFRQVEESHIMENIIYNELKIRGYAVDVGIVEISQKDEAGIRRQKQLEIDFVCNLGSKRYYIQSALSMPSEEKIQQEKLSLLKVDDYFKKIIITRDNVITHYTEDGILILNIFDFLLGSDSLELV